MKFVARIQRRVDASNMIKRNYREYRRITMLPKAIAFYKNNLATLIQKYLRGYKVAVLGYKNLRKAKLDQNHHFFTEIRLKEETKAAILISRQMNRFLRRK